MKPVLSFLAICLWVFTLKAQLPSGCEVYYPFSGNFKDALQKNTAAVNYGSSFTSDNHGAASSAVSFNGASYNYIDLGKSFSYGSTTVYAWIKPVNTGIEMIWLSN